VQAPFPPCAFRSQALPALEGTRSVRAGVLPFSGPCEVRLARHSLCVRQRKLVWIGIAASVVTLALGIWAFALEPGSLTENRRTLFIPHWSAELAGLKVVVLADLHVGSPFNGIDKLHRIVDTANAMKPDLVLVPGDLVIQGVVGGRFVPPEDSALGAGEVRNSCARGRCRQDQVPRSPFLADWHQRFPRGAA
jgi:hypothetical protein